MAVPRSQDKIKATVALSAWSPLYQPTFRSLWIATVVSNVGTWMQDVGAGWLMTSLASSPLMVALVQGARTLPVVLLAVPAGVTANIVDRRRFLLIAIFWMMLCAALLATLTFLEVTTAELLLLFTFLLGIATAMMMPAWAAIIPDLVAKRDLQAAVALNSMGMNISRTIGPWE